MSSSTYVNKNFKDIILEAVRYLDEDLDIDDDAIWVRGMNGHNELFFNKKESDFSFEISFKLDQGKTVSFKLTRTQCVGSSINGFIEPDIFSGKCALNYDVLCKVVETLYTAQYQNMFEQTEQQRVKS